MMGSGFLPRILGCAGGDGSTGLGCVWSDHLAFSAWKPRLALRLPRCWDCGLPLHSGLGCSGCSGERRLPGGSPFSSEELSALKPGRGRFGGQGRSRGGTEPLSRVNTTETELQRSLFVSGRGGGGYEGWWCRQVHQLSPPHLPQAPGTLLAPCPPFHQNVFPGHDVQPIHTWAQ